MPVEKITDGMVVWTIDSSGKRVAAEVIKTSKTEVPELFNMVKITLADGRAVTASPGHPSADSIALGDYKVGDVLDGSTIIIVDNVLYDSPVTYDILPSGETGRYWANGILLGSTLH